MQQISAIVGLTWKAAFRYRLFWVVAALLVTAVTALPLLIKDDGTAAGFAQILITYTLGAVTGLLGLCTLWLSCGTLARDVEECQIQMVAVKPVARWQIWLGKWLGIVTLNAALLAVAGMSIFGLLKWRARGLPANELFKLNNEVLVARGSVREQSLDKFIENTTDRAMKQRQEKNQLTGADLNIVRQQIKEQVKAGVQLVAPGGTRLWVIRLGAAKDSLKNQPMFLRVKFNTPQIGTTGSTYDCAWQVGTPKKTQIWQDTMNMAADTFIEFEIPPNLFDEKGDLVILAGNLSQTPLLFPLDEGMEVLYREGGFGLNFVRGLGIILCWMALLSALGLAAASFLSFPVAAFFSVAVLTVVLSSGTLSNVVSEGTIMGYNEEKGTKGHSAVDNVAVPVFAGVLDVIDLATQTATVPEGLATMLPQGLFDFVSEMFPRPSRSFSPIDSLTTGRIITWGQLGMAVGQIVLLLGGILGAAGIFIFSRRELATAQGTQ